MTAPIKFELSPRDTLNSLKFAHEQPRDVNQCWKSFLYKIRQLIIAFLATSGRCKRARAVDRPFFQWTDLEPNTEFGSNGLEQFSIKFS